MKPLVLLGIIFIVIGIIALGYQGFTYVTREKVIDVGPVEVTAEKEKTIPLPPIIGGAALVVGLVMVFAGSRSRAA
jgi:hypothetical protein